MSTFLHPTAGDTRGSYLKLLRTTAGRSTRDVEAAAKVGQGTVAHVEAGKRTNIGDAIYAAVARVLGADPAAVLALPIILPPDDTAPAMPPPGGEILATVDYALIDRSDLNPRRHFDADSISALADSIAEHGFIQPIMLRPRADAPGRYWIVVGERRWRAAGLLHEQRERYGRGDDPVCIPARIRPMSDREHLEIALIENMHRTDVAPLEEAKAIAKLVTDYDGDTAAAAQAIGKIGKSGQRFVQIAMNLIEKLTPEVQEALGDGTINKEMARHLTLVSFKQQADLLDDVRRGSIRNGKELKMRLRSGLFPANAALFGQFEYNGPVEEDPDTGAVYFTDLVQVKRLQLAAMKAKEADLRADGYPVVKLVTDCYYWSPTWHQAQAEGYAQMPADTKPPAGYQRAAALVLQSDLSVKIFTDLAKAGGDKVNPAAVKKAVAKASGDMLADFPTGAKMHARRARTMALQRALFREAGYRTLLAHLCLNLLEGNIVPSPMLAVRAEHRQPDRRAVDPEVLDVINEFRENLEFNKGEKLFVEADDSDPHVRVRSEPEGKYGSSKGRTGAIVLEALYDLEDSYLLELAMALLASRSGSWYGNGVNAEPDLGDEAETLSACKQLGLTHAVADDAGAIDWPGYLEKLNGPALDVVHAKVGMPVAFQGMGGARWKEATQKEKRNGLTCYLSVYPDKAAYIPAIFRYGDGKEIEAAMREEAANAVRPAAEAAE